MMRWRIRSWYSVKRRRPGALDVMEGPRAPRSLARGPAPIPAPPGPPCTNPPIGQNRRC